MPTIQKTLSPKDLEELNEVVKMLHTVKILGQVISDRHDSVLNRIRQSYNLSGAITYNAKTGVIT